MLVVLAIVGLFFLPSPWGVIALAAVAAVEVGEIMFWRRFLRRYRLRSGPELIVGRSATVIEACAPDGLVRLGGEVWKAHSSQGAGVGESVRVTGIDGLTLEVEPEP
jgi:membrane-bound serine protease (ClpP class)